MQAKQDFIPCEVLKIVVIDSDVIRTSDGIDVGKEVDGNPFTDWNGDAQG